MKNKRQRNERYEFGVLLYPPKGRPRVVKLPKVPFAAELIVTFATRAEAEAALTRFLNENPEYRRWNDGRIVPEATGIASV